MQTWGARADGCFEVGWPEDRQWPAATADVSSPPGDSCILAYTTILSFALPQMWSADGTLWNYFRAKQASLPNEAYDESHQCYRALGAPSPVCLLLMFFLYHLTAGSVLHNQCGPPLAITTSYPVRI